MFYILKSVLYPVDDIFDMVLFSTTDVTYLPTEQYGLNDTERRAVFDLLCVDQNQQNFIIEMQRASQPDFAERSIFYLSRAISASMEKGGYDYHILPTYSVNLLDFELPEYKNSEECFQALFLTDQKNRILTTKVAIFYIKFGLMVIFGDKYH